MLSQEEQDLKTLYIRDAQHRGFVFVCPAKDRALNRAEEACQDCDCIDLSDKSTTAGIQ